VRSTSPFGEQGAKQGEGEKGKEREGKERRERKRPFKLKNEVPISCGKGKAATYFTLTALELNKK
jgi:hypothetical protein